MIIPIPCYYSNLFKPDVKRYRIRKEYPFNINYIVNAIFF